MSDGGSSELTAQAKQREGTTLGDKYTIEKLLGVGGMAAVYAARHRNKKRCAIKVLHAQLSSHKDVRERFLREGYVANTIEHAGVVKVDDDDVTEDGSAYLVMELLEGETVEALFLRKGNKLDQVTVMMLTDQVLDILAAAHGTGIIHRDIKPENLFLHRQTQLKLLDFGIARLHEADNDTKKTVEGAVMGTPAFMAPEQARGVWDEVDAQSDLWSVGATMFALLTGEVVHKGATINEALAASITQPARPVRDLSPDVHTRLAEVVDTALQREKSERFPDAASMRRALRQAYLEAQGVELPAAAGSLVGDTSGSQPGALGQHESYPNPARASAASYGDITGTSPPVTATHASQHQRSRWPMLVGILAIVGGLGVVVAGGTGLYLYSKAKGDPNASSDPAAAEQTQAGPADATRQAPTTTPEASSNDDPVVAPADEADHEAEAETNPGSDEAKSASAASAKPAPRKKTVARRIAPKKPTAKVEPPKKAADKPAAIAAPAEPAPASPPKPKKAFDPFASRD